MLTKEQRDTIRATLPAAGMTCACAALVARRDCLNCGGTGEVGGLLRMLLTALDAADTRIGRVEHERDQAYGAVELADTGVEMQRNANKFALDMAVVSAVRNERRACAAIARRCDTGNEAASEICATG